MTICRGSSVLSLNLSFKQQKKAKLQLPCLPECLSTLPKSTSSSSTSPEVPSSPVSFFCYSAPPTNCHHLHLRHKHRSRSTTMARLTKLGITALSDNNTHSEMCKLCAQQDQQHDSTRAFPPYAKSCTIVAAGDWLSISTMLELTGPRGRHFCNLCTAKLSRRPL